MISIKSKCAIDTMRTAGCLLVQVFDTIGPMVTVGESSLTVEQAAADALRSFGLKSESLGYKGYPFVTCISFNDEVVHGMPSEKRVFCDGDLVKIDICASWRGYCADMARCFLVGMPDQKMLQLVKAAQSALDEGIKCVAVGARLSDVSATIQRVVEQQGYEVVRDFAGHGIGQQMHEEPEILNYGVPGRGPILRAGMTFAIEPMITMGAYQVYVADDGWTVKTKDASLAAHVEDTVLVTECGPEVLTRARG